MSEIHTIERIARTPEDVFNFVTTPEHWLVWHPSSISVEGAVNHPLQVGEQVTEAFVVAGRSGAVTWTVQECQPPRTWAIVGEVPVAGSGTIRYELRDEHGATRFSRRFTYQMANPLLALLDRLLVRRRIAKESQQALRTLRDVLEGQRPDAVVDKAGSAP